MIRGPWVTNAERIGERVFMTETLWAVKKWKVGKPVFWGDDDMLLVIDATDAMVVYRVMGQWYFMYPIEKPLMEDSREALYGIYGRHTSLTCAPLTMEIWNRLMHMATGACPRSRVFLTRHKPSM
ncbi:MAG: hypothetical protein COU33_01765 [Candidatus Magasanikbacteria bacterium CG10_big_fil_rev_8_21_14_0_10_43_6]|uniref:Uncharacterized protein n=1 Tax=Candidatus Magasanikbacteria bacterium CG10_big_fil_rev_8_21_14_0_10_43_6 TaxID=1974650 RepID=A0A2M6W1U0_9BACT|nr:MAG: hypothetical protein COU33_01765 [Candidatus Magasanikbacteria bacterium CG10_big_fil_rev_8_21_14_0_10_43_6]